MCNNELVPMVRGIRSGIGLRRRGNSRKGDKQARPWDRAPAFPHDDTLPRIAPLCCTSGSSRNESTFGLALVLEYRSLYDLV